MSAMYSPPSLAQAQPLTVGQVRLELGLSTTAGFHLKAVEAMLFLNGPTKSMMSD